jgi:hypothetical protein
MILRIRKHDGELTGWITDVTDVTCENGYIRVVKDNTLFEFEDADIFSVSDKDSDNIIERTKENLSAVERERNGNRLPITSARNK